ncbi:hypothetical protein ASD43_16195 [Microbacterium sp. Root553]|nr:hypothetical protein ASD43_16195 [Microbacterium sp. Root553]
MLSARTAYGLSTRTPIRVHVYPCRGDEAFFVALESALRPRLVEAAGRARIRSRLPLKARWLIDLARADADSGLESLLRLRLPRRRRASSPRPDAGCGSIPARL